MENGRYKKYRVKAVNLRGSRCRARQVRQGGIRQELHRELQGEAQAVVTVLASMRDDFDFFDDDYGCFDDYHRPEPRRRAYSPSLDELGHSSFSVLRAA